MTGDTGGQIERTGGYSRRQNGETGGGGVGDRGHQGSGEGTGEGRGVGAGRQADRGR